MEAEGQIKSDSDFSYIVTVQGEVTSISSSFTELTAYTIDDLKNKDIECVFRSLNIHEYANISNQLDKKSTYIFTKFMQPRQVFIYWNDRYETKERLYYFEEISKSRLDSNIGFYEQLFKDNLFSLAVFSVPDFTLIKVNQRYINYLPEPLNEAKHCLGKHAGILFKGYFTEEHLDLLKKAVSEAKTTYCKKIKFINHERNVTYWDYSFIPIVDEDKVKYIVLQGVDVTDFMKNEKIVRSQIDDLFTSINEIEFPIVRLSYPELKVIQINNSIVEILRKTTGANKLDIDELSRMTMYDIASICNIEKSVQCIRRVISSKKSVYLEEQKIDMDGIEKYFKTVYQPIINSDNEVIEILIILIDVTNEVKDRTQIEKVLERQGEFFYFIAHEFRTPLTTMSSTFQLLDLVYAKEMTPNLRRYLNIIRRSIFQQLRLVNNLLDITRAEAGYLKLHKKNHDIVSVTREIVYSIKPFAENKGIRLRFRSSLKEKIVGLDEEKYERILLNLLSNAVKFSLNNQTISVTLSENDGKVIICVKDRGVGIPKDKHIHIFERFGQEGSRRSRAGEGTGIGLYLVKLLVESMNGSISICSSENKGSTFIVTLPSDTLTVDDFNTLPEFTNNRLIQGMQLEFSNIYLD